MGHTPIHWLFLGEDFHPMFGNYSPLRGRELLQIKQCMQAVRAHDMEMAVINYKDRDGKTAMHLAAESYLPELATYLLEQGADPNLTDSTGRTPLMALIVDSYKRQETRKIVIYSIIGAVENINAIDDHGNSALHLACSHYTRLWTANVLIEQGALCHIANGSGQTPLHKAAACLWRPWLNHCNFKSYYDAEQSQDRVVALLLEKCHDLCNMGSKDFSGRCPADILAETRLRASEYIEDEVREEVKSKLERINDAYIRAGFQIMPPGIQDLVETAGGNLALRTTNPRISLRTSLRTGMGRGRGALMTPPVFLTIPPHRRRISFESTAFN
ncbi:hypothetical protein E8E14_002587 [Neopestalotiopsis sp. 37M]|nr:hypothetical protein E8E14_002587 [Neopestalotiopsis sp. 37M]